MTVDVKALAAAALEAEKECREAELKRDRTRTALFNALDNGDRKTIDGLGYVLRTNPGKRTVVNDPDKFLAWVKVNAPGEVQVVETVRPSFTSAVLRGHGVVAGTGEVADGLVEVEGRPSLQVKPVEQGVES